MWTTAMGEKNVFDTCKDKVEDEHHFLSECPLKEDISDNFFQKLYNIMTRDPVVERHR